MDLGRGISRLANWRRHRRRWARRGSAGEGATGADDDRARRARRLVRSAGRAPRPKLESARELAVARERWAVRARCERGYTELLPDLAVWIKPSGPPVAVIAESGHRREDRQKMILEAWRDAVLSGRYGGVHYHCASVSVARWISRLAARRTCPQLLRDT